MMKAIVNLSFITSGWPHSQNSHGILDGLLLSKPNGFLLHKFVQASLMAQLVKESTYNAGDPGSTPGLGRSAGERIGHPLQYPWASLVAQLIKNPPAM